MMVVIEARVWRSIIFTGLAIAAIGLSCGCARETIAAAPPSPSSSYTSDETALLTASSVVLHFNPSGFYHNTRCSGETIGQNGNVIDILTAGTCVPSPYMEGSWGNTMKLLFVDPTTQEMRVITPHNVKAAMDKNSGLALVTATLVDHRDAESLTPVKMSGAKLSPKTNYDLTAFALAGGMNNEEKEQPDSGFSVSQLLNKYQVHGIAPAQDSSGFKDCEGSSELKRMAWQTPSQDNILTKTDIASRDWFYFHMPTNDGALNDAGFGVFDPQTRELIGIALDTIRVGEHVRGTGFDCSIALYPNEKVVQSLIAKNHPQTVSLSH
jgi:hypothetical protein